MTDEQITLLKKALEFYSFVLDHIAEDYLNHDQTNEFYAMKEALSSAIGVDVT